VRAAAKVRALGFQPAPHIAARRLASVSELDAFLAALADQSGADQAFVIAGDFSSSIGPFEDSLSVIRSGLLARHGIRKIGISGYPDGHPGIPSDVLRQALHDKLRLLGDSGYDGHIMTQFSFDAQQVLEWLARLRDSGVVAPVRVGVPGPASVKTLLRFATRCGVAASAKAAAKYGISLSRLLSTAGPDAFVAELADGLDPVRHGKVSLHFFPFGGLTKAAEWISDNGRD
jgi:methylenetetrahydrofolate reductase (NADPH)